MNIAETSQSFNPSHIQNSKSNQIIKISKNTQKNPTATEDTGTTISNLSFLKKNIKEQPLNNLNSQKGIPRVTISLQTEEESNNSQKNKNLAHKKSKSFIKRTKDWAGNIWNSMKDFKFKKIFAKAEYKEFRNANGDIVKIPVKKIPLKKKKESNEILKNKISLEQNRIVSTSIGIYLA